MGGMRARRKAMRVTMGSSRRRKEEPGTRRTRVGAIFSVISIVRASLAEEEVGMTWERRMRMRRRRRMREVKGIRRTDMDHTLHRIIDTVIHRNITCFITALGNLFVGNSVKAPTYESLIHYDTVLKTCGGPAPGVAPHRPIVLLLPPSRTLGGRSVPDKRVVPPRGGGP
jgi:hypothetical protein